MGEDPYLDPTTGLLRNLLGINDAGELARAEAAYTGRRIRELERQPIPGRFGLAHLQAIHRYITQDLVDWAGALRTLDISKGGTSFCPVQNLHAFAGQIFDELARSHHLRDLTREDFVTGLATFYGDLNALHPFREFNGRTQRTLMSQLAHQAGWHIATALPSP
ncbi:MAG: Fic/DOC family protein [Acidimicrobiales bacterium]